jgi:hypothetical protein
VIPNHLSIYLSIYLSIHPSIYLSIYLSVSGLGVRELMLPRGEAQLRAIGSLWMVGWLDMDV